MQGDFAVFLPPLRSLFRCATERRWTEVELCCSSRSFGKRERWSCAAELLGGLCECGDVCITPNNFVSWHLTLLHEVVDQVLPCSTNPVVCGSAWTRAVRTKRVTEWAFFAALSLGASTRGQLELARAQCLGGWGRVWLVGTCVWLIPFQAYRSRQRSVCTCNLIEVEDSRSDRCGHSFARGLSKSPDAVKAPTNMPK